MSAHRQQAFLGYLFLTIGLALIALASAPTILGLRATPPVHIDVPLVLLFAGIAVAILGALLIPSSGASPIVAQFFALIAPWAPRAATAPPIVPPADPPVNDP